MNRRFSNLLFAVLVSLASLAFPSTALCQQKLRLILEGPFVLCEQDSQHLRIYIPLAVGDASPGRHFTPGIKSYFTEEELGQGKTYQLLPDTAGQMQIGTLQGEYPAGTSRTVTLDHISGQCSITPQNSYASIIIPKPDLIRPLSPVFAKVYDCSQPPPDHKDLYGTSSELLYQSMNLASLQLTDTSSGLAWPAQVDPDDGYLLIYLRSMYADQNDHKDSLDSYKEMMRMAGVNRCFDDPDPLFIPALTPSMSQGAMATTRSRKGKNSGHQRQAQPSLLSHHNDCHAPQLLICKNAGCR